MPKFYTKILLSLTLSITITIFVVSSILYFTFERIGLNIAHNSNKDGLSQISYSATLMNDLAKSLSLQVYFNDTISKLSYASLPDVREEYLALDQLRSYRATSPFVDSIYVYNSKRDTLYTSLVNIEKIEPDQKGTFFDQGILQILKNMKDYKRITPIPRNIDNAYPGIVSTPSKNVYTFLFYDSYAEKIPLDDHIIILNISENWLRNMIDLLNTEPQSNTFIIDNDGKMVISDQENGILTDLSGLPYIHKILASNRGSGYFVDVVNDIKSLVSYVSSDAHAWKFIRVTPYSSIMHKINEMKSKTFLFGILILVSGLLLSLVLSRKLYRPIHNIASSLSIMQKEKGNEEKYIFLRNILRNDTRLADEVILKKFHTFHTKLNPGSPLVLMLFKIDGFKSFVQNNSANGRSLIKFSIMNIASEILSALYECEAVDVDTDHIVVLSNVDSGSAHEVYAALESLIKNIQNYVQTAYKVSLSVAISPIANTLSEAGDLYDETVDASNYRLTYGHGCIITPDHIKALSDKPYTYPSDKEKMLIDALLLGKVADAQNIYIHIVNHTVSYSYNIVRSGLLRLAVDMNMVLDTIQRNSGKPMPYNLNAFISELDKLETLEEINEHFFALFGSITAKLKEKTSAKHDELIQDVVEMIHHRHSDMNLSIDTIAYQFKMSSMYLGRLFKKINGKSVAEYITEVRLEQAKELLANTEYPINEISERVGFLSSGYFYTLFKKATGLTPNQYRKSLPPVG
ncbi:helix-turn-helix domain-containing protein [Paenibacillus agaridevorans]|nr:helix-turn-helix domain-containing protein [Paenibacillus agaridevorans]